jgi:hypothetical protein
MSQMSFSDAEYAGKRKRTRREEFLAEMEKVVPWSALESLIEPHYPKAGGGRRPYPLATMLRIHLMQNWFGFSDPAMEEALYEITPLRQFARLRMTLSSGHPLCGAEWNHLRNADGPANLLGVQKLRKLRPAVKTLREFDFAFQPSIQREQIDSLHTLGFLERRENVVFLGPPGVGKTHLAISLAIAAAEHGRRVYFGTLVDLIDSLQQAKAAGRLNQRLAVLTHPSLLVVDEIGYLPATTTKDTRESEFSYKSSGAALNRSSER